MNESSKTLTSDEFHLVPHFGFHYHLILASDLMAEPHFTWKMPWVCSVNTRNKPEKCDPMWSGWCKTKKENTKLRKITCRLQVYVFIVSLEVKLSTSKTTDLYTPTQSFCTHRYEIVTNSGDLPAFARDTFSAAGDGTSSAKHSSTKSYC